MASRSYAELWVALWRSNDEFALLGVFSNEEAAEAECDRYHQAVAGFGTAYSELVTVDQPLRGN